VTLNRDEAAGGRAQVDLLVTVRLTYRHEE